MHIPTDSNLQRLAEHVTRRRVQLGMTKIDVARAAGLTITTYGHIERGKAVRDSSYGKIEAPLQWAPGSCLEVLRGGNPTVAEPSGIQGVSFSPISGSDLETDVASAVQDAAIAVTDSLSAEEIRKLKQRVVEELRARGYSSESE